MWLKKAEENLSDAKYMFKGCRYAPTCFLCQQTLEVVIKAAIIERTDKPHPKVHDLVKLYKVAGLENMPKYLDFLDKTNRHYFQVRYPDFVKARYNRTIAKELLDKTEITYLWIKNQITQR